MLKTLLNSNQPSFGMILVHVCSICVVLIRQHATGEWYNTRYCVV